MIVKMPSRGRVHEDENARIERHRPSGYRRSKPARTARNCSRSADAVATSGRRARSGWFVLSRLISDGMHEDLDITNSSTRRVRFQFEIALRCDFADIFEEKSGDIVHRGRVTTTWSRTDQQLRTSYRNGDFM